jgi:hypothetical protein
MENRLYPGVAALVLFASITSAVAEPAALPTEHVIVTSPKDAPDTVVNHFVQSFTSPSYLTGKVARWERGICPVTLGLAAKFTAFITSRVRAVAARAGAPVDKDLSCRPNIEIVFTTAPQALLDGVRKDHKMYLGYAEGAHQFDKLAVVNHPIQAWYMTATKDLDGKEEVDSFNTAPLETVRLPVPYTPGYIDLYIPGGAKKITGGRLKDGLRTVLHHVIITADPTKLADYEVGTLADYIAMLALTQLNSLDTCQQLPSIINLLSPNCPGPPNAISDSDLGYLSGLYSMGADGNLRMQQDGIAYQLRNTLSGK